jgi:hypothetical protein
MNYNFGHVEPWWTTEHTSLDYNYIPHPDNSNEIFWNKQGFGFFNLNGQVCSLGNQVPEFALPFLTLHNWDDIGLNFYCMNQGDALPTHSDLFATYKSKFNLNSKDIWRCVVFLEDWKSGHYFEVAEQAFVNWKAGDYVVWNYDVPHYAANIGIEPRYTLQITGHV